ncbi:MAG: alpha-L-fucosidase, partial [Cytophagales bacterium CG18_big_fil_WC_8_21_14_2_50_42_9]
MWFIILFLALPAFSQETGQASGDELKIWFNHPANNWNEALPVGNGRLGAMVFGGITNERLQLNEESVWSGKPEDFVNPNSRQALPQVRELLFAGKYAEAQKLAQENMMGDKKTNSSYQTLGDLQLEFLNQQNISEYRRELDLETAVAKVSYRTEKAFFTREIFSSAPDQVLVVRLTADKPGALAFNLKYSRPGDKAKITAVKDELTVSEHIN